MKKDFDIEKLNKTVPYEVPDGFFSEVQERVLQRTIHKIGDADEGSQQAKSVFNRNWIYAAAATIIGFFVVLNLVDNGAEQNDINTTKTLVTKVNVVQKTASPLLSSSEVLEKPQMRDSQRQRDYAENNAASQKLSEEKQTLAKITQTRLSEPSEEKRQSVDRQTFSDNNHSKTKNMMVNTANIDQMLEALPESELNELANNIENDVYLDLF